MEDFIVEYIEQMDLEKISGVGIIGSFSTEKQKKWSDVDLLCLVDVPMENKIELFKDKYFSISYYTQKNFDAYLKEPLLQLNGLDALKNMKILYDPKTLLNEIQKVLKSYKLTSVDKEKALYMAKLEYISFIEEAQKALQGLMDHHHGKMLNGLYGLTFGMFKVISLRDYIRISSDNDFYKAVMETLDDKDPIKQLAPQAFGIDQTKLEDQVEAGLELFMHVGNSLMSHFDEDEKKYGLKLIHEIIKEV